MDVLGNLSTLQTTLAALAGIAGVLFAFWRWARPRFKSVTADVRAGRDALVGRGEIRDSITGRVLVPALPGMGVRMDTSEHELREQRTALTSLADAVTRLADQGGQLHDHERRIKHLEDAAVERVVARAESAAAWHAIEAVANNGGTVPQDGQVPDVEVPSLGEN